MVRSTNAGNGINTRLAHIGNDPHEFFGFVNPPVVHASTVLFPNAQAMTERGQRYTYGTRGTPTTDALTAAINELEGSAGTIVVPSGLAAVTVPLLSFLAAGDHMLVTDSVYSPTRRFSDTFLKRLGVEVDYYDPYIGADIAGLIRSNTKIVFTESPGSNTFEVQDIPAIVKAAHSKGALVFMDNTWATPLFFKPLDHGVDVSIHAATKYPAGHSDVLIGTASATKDCWPQLQEGYFTLGTCSGPDDVYQMLRGLRTMGIRLGRHQASANAIAAWLEKQPGVARVLHPSLPSNPGHALWKRDFCGSSGIFSIELASGGKAEAHAFLNALRIFGLGYSWGGFESLAVIPYLEDRTVTKSRYKGPLLRLQIGLEDVDDLKADMLRGLEAAAYTG